MSGLSLFDLKAAYASYLSQSSDEKLSYESFLSLHVPKPKPVTGLVMVNNPGITLFNQILEKHKSNKNNEKTDIVQMELEQEMGSLSLYAKKREKAVDQVLNPDLSIEKLRPFTEQELETIKQEMKKSNYYHCLKPGSWLNDEVINDHLDILKAKFVGKIHYFVTFFYTKITNKIGSQLGEYCYKNVARWTRTLPKFLLEYEQIHFPIHVGVSHWCLAVARVKEKTITYYDSLFGSDGGCLKILLRYLCDEAKEKKNLILDPSEWSLIVEKKCPIQRNGYDCGVFTCKMSEYISCGIDLSFTQENMPYFRQRLVLDISQFKRDYP